MSAAVIGDSSCAPALSSRLSSVGQKSRPAGTSDLYRLPTTDQPDSSAPDTDREVNNSIDSGDLQWCPEPGWSNSTLRRWTTSPPATRTRGHRATYVADWAPTYATIPPTAPGTSLTPVQARLLVDQPGQRPVIVATDPDAAGQSAAALDFWRLTTAGDTPRHAVVPDGLDPRRAPELGSVSGGL